MAKEFTLELDRFLGWHDSADDSNELSAGESPAMLNFSVTEGYKLKKREGFSSVFDSELPIRGIWHGTVNGEELFCTVLGDQLHISRDGFDTLVPCEGGVPGEGEVEFFPFYGTLYLLTGIDIVKLSEERVSLLEPYVPCIMTATAPNGEGTLFEEINALTSHVWQSFTPDGKSTDFYLASSRIDEIDFVRFNGMDVSTEQYIWDEFRGCISFTTPLPENSTDSLAIGYTIRRSTDEAEERIRRCRHALAFGGANDTRAFLYGNTDFPAMRFHSGIASGAPTFEYFPETAYTLIGNGEEVTGIVRHYDRQLIFTPHTAFYSTMEYSTEENGKLRSSFPVFPLSSDKGNAPSGQALLIQNEPYTFCENGLFRWVSTNIRDERNAVSVTDAISRPLLAEASDRARLFHRSTKSELWIVFEGRVYIYNYALGLFYYYEFPPIKAMCEVGETMYFVSADSIFRLGGNSDNGEEIPCYWRSKKFDFDDFSHLKKIYSLSLFCLCAEKSLVQVNWQTEKMDSKGSLALDFSQQEENLMGSVVRRRRLHARHFTLFQLELEGSGADNPVHILTLALKGKLTDKSAK